MAARVLNGESHSAARRGPTPPWQLRPLGGGENRSVVVIERATSSRFASVRVAVCTHVSTCVSQDLCALASALLQSSLSLSLGR